VRTGICRIGGRTNFRPSRAEKHLAMRRGNRIL